MRLREEGKNREGKKRCGFFIFNFSKGFSVSSQEKQNKRKAFSCFFLFFSAPLPLRTKGKIEGFFAPLFAPLEGDKKSFFAPLFAPLEGDQKSFFAFGKKTFLTSDGSQVPPSNDPKPRGHALEGEAAPESQGDKPQQGVPNVRSCLNVGLEVPRVQIGDGHEQPGPTHVSEFPPGEAVALALLLLVVVAFSVMLIRRRRAAAGAARGAGA